jgi:hypothetical protein
MLQHTVYQRKIRTGSYHFSCSYSILNAIETALSMWGLMDLYFVPTQNRLFKSLWISLASILCSVSASSKWCTSKCKRNINTNCRWKGVIVLLLLPLIGLQQCKYNTMSFVCKAYIKFRMKFKETKKWYNVQHKPKTCIWLHKVWSRGTFVLL